MEIVKGNIKGKISDLIIVDGVRLSDLKRGLTNKQIVDLMEYMTKLQQESREYKKRVNP